jgi:hypothetical protein
MSAKKELLEHRASEMINAIFEAVPKGRIGNYHLKCLRDLVLHPDASAENKDAILIGFIHGLCAGLPADKGEELLTKAAKWSLIRSGDEA